MFLNEFYEHLSYKVYLFSTFTFRTWKLREYSHFQVILLDQHSPSMETRYYPNTKNKRKLEAEIFCEHTYKNPQQNIAYQI